MNIISLGEENLKLLGEKVSFVFEGKEYTNTWMNENGKRLAAGLRSIGIRRGNHVVVSMPNCPEVFLAFHAIWRVGAVVIPLMFLLGEEESRYILDDSDAKVVITGQDLLGKIDKARRGIEHIEFQKSYFMTVIESTTKVRRLFPTRPLFPTSRGLGERQFPP